MRHILYAKSLFVLLLTVIITACNATTGQPPQLETATSMPTANPTETATLVPTPTKIVTPVTPTPEFAPFCEPGDTSTLLSAGCQLPIAEQSSSFCTKKIPYNLIVASKGVTYEVIGENFKCSDAGQKDGKQMIACTGPMASPYALQVCDPACAIPTVQADITQCPQDYIYNTLQGCCSQEFQPVDQNCVLLKLKTTRCSTDCGQYTKKSACTNNSYACNWDNVNSRCVQR